MCEVELAKSRFAWSCAQCHLKASSTAPTHPTYHQGIVVSTPPTSPSPQFPDSSLRFPANLGCSFRFTKTLSKQEQCCSGGLGAACGLADQTDCVYLLIRYMSIWRGLFSLLEAPRGSSLHLPVSFSRTRRNMKSLISFCSTRLSCSQSTGSNLAA